MFVAFVSAVPFVCLRGDTKKKNKAHKSLILWALSLVGIHLSLKPCGAYGTLTYTIRKSHKTAIY